MQHPPGLPHPDLMIRGTRSSPDAATELDVAALHHARRAPRDFTVDHIVAPTDAIARSVLGRGAGRAD